MKRSHLESGMFQELFVLILNGSEDHICDTQWGSHTGVAYSRWGLMREMYIFFKDSEVMSPSPTHKTPACVNECQWNEIRRRWELLTLSRVTVALIYIYSVNWCLTSCFTNTVSLVAEHLDIEVVEDKAEDWYGNILTHTHAHTYTHTPHTHTRTHTFYLARQGAFSDISCYWTQFGTNEIASLSWSQLFLISQCVL